MLTGKYNPGNIPRGDVREGNELFAPKNLEAVKDILSLLRSLGEKYSKTPAQIALILSSSWSFFIALNVWLIGICSHGSGQ